MKPIIRKHANPVTSVKFFSSGRCMALMLLILIQTSILRTGAKAQQTPANDTARQVITSIPIPEITRQATEVSSLIMNKQKNLLTDDNKAAIVSSTDTLIFRLNLLREDPRVHKIESLNFRILNNLEGEWSLLHSLLLNEQGNLTKRVQDLENEIKSLAEMQTIWQNTLMGIQKVEAPELVIEQIKLTLDNLGKLQSAFQSDSEFLQERLVQVSMAMIFVNEIIGKITLAREVTTKKLFELNQPPIWHVSEPKEKGKVFKERRSFIDDTIISFKDFVHNYSFRIWMHLMVFLILLVFVLFSYRLLKHFTPGEDMPRAAAINKIIKRPFSSLLLISFLITYILYDNIPESVKLINMIILLIPVLVIITDIITRKIRMFIYFTAAAVLLVQVHGLAYSDSLFSRIFLMIIIVFGLLCLAWIIQKKSMREYILSVNLGKVLHFLATFSFILLAVSFFATIAGAVNLAEFITYGIIKSAALILVFYTLNLTIKSIIIISLYSKGLQKLNLIKQYSEIIYKRLVVLVDALSWILWLILTLSLFTIWDDIYKWVLGLFTHAISVGTVSMSLGNIVVFALIVWLTLWVSKVVRIIIEGEVAPKIKLKRGVPGAISLILRIAVITIGFLFAVAAAGVDMNKLALLLGALGVGIGFGLQNIFNNLVSGIILAFERPIQVGDIIEVGEFWGTVKEIGIRSSTIFTFDGAEVIVPNGNLISKELINWTLTDRQRRAEVLVGVAYGTDPDTVLKILQNIPGTHKQVLKEPAPLALFTGFGSSSLDFRLLFWINRADERLRIQSEINVAVNKALKDAGIEIPFPQQDLHIRSVDSGVMKGLKGKK
jgi:potassium efflux system protein